MPATQTTQTTGYARVAIAVLRIRISEDGKDGVSSFSTLHEPAMCRAVRRLIKHGTFARVDGPRGEIRVKAGSQWLAVLGRILLEEAVPRRVYGERYDRGIDISAHWLADALDRGRTLGPAVTELQVRLEARPGDKGASNEALF